MMGAVRPLLPTVSPAGPRYRAGRSQCWAWLPGWSPVGRSQVKGLSGQSNGLLLTSVGRLLATSTAATCDVRLADQRPRRAFDSLRRYALSMPIPHDYAERVYAGVLGKLIGVYLGRPFEGWTYERIMAELGEVRYYVNDRTGVSLRNRPLVVADDDIS